MKNEDAYASGRTAFSKGKLKKPTNDQKFMVGLVGGSRSEKQALMLEWKRGWDDAKNEIETEVKKPVAKKKAKKKAKRKAKK